MRNEPHCILDPKDVYDPDSPGVTFYVFKEKEGKQYGEYPSRACYWKHATDRKENNSSEARVCRISSKTICGV